MNGTGSRPDPGDLDAIIKEYRSGLTFFIQRYVKDGATAEELAIDVFADLIVHPHRYNGRSSLKTYLYTAGRSRAIDWLRRRNRQKQLPLEVAANETADSSPEEQFLSDERRRAVHAALAELPEEMRAAVHLVYFEALSYEQAAKVLRKNRKQIDNLLYRAKRLLRTILEKEAVE